MKAGSLYFALVFGTGFLLGVVRTLVVVPWVGARTAELGELPLMLAATFVAARWTTQKLAVPRALGARLVMGTVALVWMLIAEFGFMLWLRGLTLAEYFATRDPVSSAAYYFALALFAAMPALLALRWRKRGRETAPFWISPHPPLKR